MKQHRDLMKRPCDPSPELQLVLLKDISVLWDKVETYKGYAEEERLLRIRAVAALRKHEEHRKGRRHLAWSS